MNRTARFFLLASVVPLLLAAASCGGGLTPAAAPGLEGTAAALCPLAEGSEAMSYCMRRMLPDARGVW